MRQFAGDQLEEVVGHSNQWRTIAVAAGILTLSACANPYALKASSLNYTAEQAAGTIEVSDPKLYKREALINERRREVAYIDGLVESSKTQTFAPELIRELEVITSLSAAAGLRFDPAAALNYRNDAQTSELQQEINTLKLQLQLEQLRRDAEILRAGFGGQTSLVNADLGKVGDVTVAAPASAVSAASAEQLSKAVAALQISLASRLDAAGKPPATVTAGVNPIDAFQDRAAYRDLLNSARNAASLDELHDKDGSALVRLSFAATVLPPGKSYGDTLGILRMTAIPPDWNEAGLVETLYRQWISHISRTYNIRESDRAPSFRENPAVRGLALSREMFDTVYYFFPITADAVCDGLSFWHTQLKNPEKCGRLSLAAPRLTHRFDPAPTGRLHQRPESIRHDQRSGDLHRSYDMLTGPLSHLAEGRSIGYDQAAQFLRNNVSGDLLLGCRINFTGAAARSPTMPASKVTLGAVIEDALNTYVLGQIISDLELQARKTLLDAELSPSDSTILINLIRPRVAAATKVVSALQEHAAGQRCKVAASDLQPLQIPLRFREVVTNPEYRVSVYEVGPRERVQQLSTIARAADAIGLAAAIAGALPAKGLGMDGNLAYSRSAAGKADALERAPLIVSFAEAKGVQASQPAAFGWLLGPRANLEPRKQALVLEHQVKPYDLSVDLALPGWWPHVDLATQAAWAPNWRHTAGSIMSPVAAGKKLRVRMAPNSGDLAGLTGLIAGEAVRLVSITDLQPQTLSPCSDMRLQLIGDNVWRASAVMIGGRMISGDKVEVLPDMAGVTVSADRGAFPALESDGKLAVTALTPYGRAVRKVAVRDAKPDGTCSTKDETPSASAKPPGPTITKIEPPEVSVCDPSPIFTVTGQNLKDVTSAMLNTAVGQVSQAGAKDGSLLQVKFSSPQMRSSFAGLAKVRLVVRTAKGDAAEKEVALAVPSSCP